jgi:hypothetical protein
MKTPSAPGMLSKTLCPKPKHITETVNNELGGHRHKKN